MYLGIVSRQNVSKNCIRECIKNLSAIKVAMALTTVTVSSSRLLPLKPDKM